MPWNVGGRRRRSRGEEIEGSKEQLWVQECMWACHGKVGNRCTLQGVGKCLRCQFDSDLVGGKN